MDHRTLTQKTIGLENLLTPSIRFATAADAPTIVSLFQEAYLPPEFSAPGLRKKDASSYFPYPQLMNAHWVSSAIEDSNVIWLVAESDGKVVGSFGTILNIGGPDECVSEMFGLVVQKDFQSNHLGKLLFQNMIRLLDAQSTFIICEVRSAHPRAFNIVRQHGFEVIGFEPFCHRTPAGHESMILFGRIPKPHLSHNSAVTPKSAALSRLNRLKGLGKSRRFEKVVLNGTTAHIDRIDRRARIEKTTFRKEENIIAAILKMTTQLEIILGPGTGTIITEVQFPTWEIRKALNNRGFQLTSALAHIGIEQYTLILDSTLAEAERHIGFEDAALRQFLNQMRSVNL